MRLHFQLRYLERFASMSLVSFVLFSLVTTSDLFRVGKHASVAVWGHAPAVVPSQQQQDDAGIGLPVGGGRGSIEANPTGLVQPPPGQRSMLETLNDGDDDDMSDSTQSSGEDDELEITCKPRSDGSRRQPHDCLGSEKD